MKKIELEIPEGKEAKWVNGVLTLVDEQPVEFKFKVGDKVKHKNIDRVEVITECINCQGIPIYKTDASTLTEEQIEPYTPKDITERIKTFKDAMEWCTLNGKNNLVHEYDCIHTDSLIIDEPTADLIAYLKLRIITCALNEGWEPTFEGDEIRYTPRLDDFGYYATTDSQDIYGDAAYRLTLKSEELAEYAGKTFQDIYMDFCYKHK